MRLYDYAASANCLKVRLLCSLLGLPYERVPVDIFGGDTLTDAFARLNPARETPVLELDDGTVVTQSNAILWLLAEGTALLPADAGGRAQVVQWLSFEQEWVMNGVGGARFRTLTGRDPETAAARRATGAEGLGILERHLAGRGLVVGDRPSIADVSLYAYAHVAGEAGLDLETYPAIRAWLARVEALDGFANDLEPYPDNARPGRGRSTYDG
jgi:glutathione S-transferase